MMKLRLAGLSVLVVTLAAFLSACGGSNKAMKGQTTPAQAAQVGSKAMPAGTTKGPRVMQKALAGKWSGQAMVMLKDVHFDFDRYTIRPQDAEMLKKDYTWFKANPGALVRIEGNCDERGTIEYNLALGQKRADSTKTFLAILGVPVNQLKTESYGEEKPVDPGHDEEAWAKNRRAHLEWER
ncbi:MAG: peptidoglycan-associated lipoprotein Pal [Syntrophorhabdales bacterium]|jgi:peptidoglycan-associated lipoprotein